MIYTVVAVCVVVYALAFTGMPDMERQILKIHITNFSDVLRMGSGVQVFSPVLVTAFQYTRTVLAILLTPFVYLVKPDIMRHHKLEGSLYGVWLAVKRDARGVADMGSKLFWYHSLTRHGVRTPAVVAIIDSGTVTPFTEFDPSKKYVFKPDRGTWGLGITFETLDEFMAEPKHGRYLVQERAYDCAHPETARHFRIVTIHAEDCYVFEVIKYTQTDAGKIASNRHQGSELELCHGLKCGVSNEEQRQLDEAMQTLTRLHKTAFAFCPSIGWDLVLTCEGPSILEGNVSAGILASPNEPELNTQIIASYESVMRNIYSNEQYTRTNRGCKTELSI